MNVVCIHNPPLTQMFSRTRAELACLRASSTSQFINAMFEEAMEVRSGRLRPHMALLPFSRAFRNTGRETGSMCGGASTLHSTMMFPKKILGTGASSLSEACPMQQATKQDPVRYACDPTRCCC